MTQCTRCGRRFSWSQPDSSREEAICSQCGAAPTTSHPTQWKPIARLSNLAEAGFYADFLEGEGYVARVHHRNDYSALDSTWESSFELQVAEDQVKQAFAALQEGIELHEDGEELGDHLPQNEYSHRGADPGDSEYSPYARAAVEFESGRDADRGAFRQGRGDRDLDSRTRSGAFTPSLAWVLVAGGLAYTLGRSGFGPGLQAEPDVLWQTIRHSSPFISEPAEGSPRRCLRYDRARREFVLEEDRNGDGVWDRQWRFVPQP
jgi:hypothetical protein